MKVVFDGQDYLLMLNKKNKELEGLPKVKLEASLQGMWGEGELGKKVILEFKENEHADGIDLEYLPKEHSGWKDIKEIRVKVNQRAYNYIFERGNFGTRYNGSDKIEIMNGYLPGFE